MVYWIKMIIIVWQTQPLMFKHYIPVLKLICWGSLHRVSFICQVWFFFFFTFCLNVITNHCPWKKNKEQTFFVSKLISGIYLQKLICATMTLFVFIFTYKSVNITQWSVTIKFVKFTLNLYHSSTTSGL